MLEMHVVPYLITQYIKRNVCFIVIGSINNVIYFCLSFFVICTLNLEADHDLTDQDDGCKGPVGQLLLGADCTKLFPFNVINRKGNLIMTANCTLLKSDLTK